MTGLIAYPLTPDAAPLRSAPLERAWMDKSIHKFAYRCLPLNIANRHGWEILSPSSITCAWNGSPKLDAIMIRTDEGPEYLAPKSHFGEGVLTFHPSYLFRTPPGWHLLVTGPLNRPKRGISPLTGIVETDKAHETFTVNWIMTEPLYPVRFAIGEPIAHIFPIPANLFDGIIPRIETIPDAVKAKMDAWRDSRDKFNADLKIPGSEAVAAGWQKEYFRASSRRKLSLPEFKRDAAGSTPVVPAVCPEPGDG